MKSVISTPTTFKPITIELTFQTEEECLNAILRTNLANKFFTGDIVAKATPRVLKKLYPDLKLYGSIPADNVALILWMHLGEKLTDHLVEVQS